MDRTCSASQLAPKNTRKNFFQWAVKWFYASLPEDTSKKSDIPKIICLLQAIGFKLLEFEKRSPVICENDDVKPNSIRVTMECGSSNMTAVLEMDGITCECLDQNEAKDGSFWSITGTGPMASMDSINRFEETGSNLLPEMSKETTAVVRDVVHKLIKLISNNCNNDDQSADLNADMPVQDVNMNISKAASIKEGLVRSYTDFYQHKPSTLAKLSSNLASSKCSSSSRSIKDAETSEKPKLKRQGTYDLEEAESMDEPRLMPPNFVSSPEVDPLCVSLDQLSLQSDEESMGLADYIVRAHHILEKAMKTIINKLPSQSTPTKSQPKPSEMNNNNNNPRADDATFLKPAPPPQMSASFCASSPRSRSVNANNPINRSLSNASSRSTSSSTTSGSRIATATTRSTLGNRTSTAPRSGSLALPPMRDRSSSLSAAQRPHPSPKTVAGQLRRKSATAVSTLALTPRSASASSKFPASSKLTQARSNTSLAAERPVLLAKRRSPDTKNQISYPAVTSQARANVSLIKAPSTVSRLNTSTSTKFGFTAAKK